MTINNIGRYFKELSIIPSEASFYFICIYDIIIWVISLAFAL